MKIKTYITNIVAIITLVVLVSGFQFNSIDKQINTADQIFGIEEAYAGPCGAAGCDGADMYCTSATVIHIGAWKMEKDCKGNPPEQD